MAQPSPAPTSSTLVNLADDPVFVFCVYALVLTPLALYVYHDILDSRWRPVWSMFRFLIAYTVLYLLSGAGLVVYIVVQAYAEDYKEVGASVLALTLGTYGALKLVRLFRILLAHRQLVFLMRRIDSSCLTGLTPVGLPYHLLRPPSSASSRRDAILTSRHHFMSSVIFDDDYPGESAARIRWLAFFGGKICVVRDDADECASRVAIWIRLVLRPPRSEPWRLLSSTPPFVSSQRYRPSLGEALRSLISHGSHLPAPSHADPNPAELLLNNGSMTQAAVGFFWIAAEMGVEEVGQVLSEMPPLWMRGVVQNGKQLMFESVMALLLCDMPAVEPEGLRWVLSLPILDWDTRRSDERVWSQIADICADAVATFMTRSQPDDDDAAAATAAEAEVVSVADAYDVVKEAVFKFKDARSDNHRFQGDIVGLSLLELIRASYRSAYLAEQILGKELENSLVSMSDSGRQVRLYKAEITSGLFSVFLELGQGNSDEFKKMTGNVRKRLGVSNEIEDMFLTIRERAKQEMESSFLLDDAATSRYWYAAGREGKCPDPWAAFASVVTTAQELAPLTACMAKTYTSRWPRINLERKQGDPEAFRRQWMMWKRAQAIEVNGGVGTAGRELGGVGYGDAMT